MDLRNPLAAARIRFIVSFLFFAAACAAGAATAQADEKLSWKFKPGDKIGYELEMEMSIAESERTVKVVHLIWMTLTVGEVAENGTASITQTVERMAAEITPPAEVGAPGPLKFDSKEGLKTDEDKKDPALSMMAPVFEAMIGKPIAMKVTAQGAVSDVKIPETMIAALKKSPAAQMSDLFTPDGIKQTASRIITPLPAGDVAVGKTWNSTIELAVPMVGKQITKTEYKLAGTEEKDGKQVAKLDVEATSKFSSDANSQLKIVVKDQDSEGVVFFDKSAGRVLSSTLTDKMTLEIELGGMKRDQTVTSVITLKQSKPGTSREL